MINVPQDKRTEGVFNVILKNSIEHEIQHKENLEIIITNLHILSDKIYKINDSTMDEDVIPETQLQIKPDLSIVHSFNERMYNQERLLHIEKYIISKIDSIMIQLDKLIY